MRKNKSKSKPKTKSRAVPGPQIVRAWFDTVINPLVKGLEKENSLLLRSNWTWQFRTGSLEYIRHAKHYVPAAAQENLEQFLDFYPNVKAGIDQHDHAVEALVAACSRLHGTLVNLSPLSLVYEEVSTLDSLRSLANQSRHRGGAVEDTRERLLAEYFGGYPPSDHIALLAQYIINNTGDLPDHFTTAPFWNRFRERFTSILQSPGVAEQYRKTSGAGARLRETSVALSQTLQQIRFELSAKHDVPYVDPSSVQHSNWPY